MLAAVNFMPAWSLKGSGFATPAIPARSPSQCPEITPHTTHEAGADRHRKGSPAALGQEREWPSSGSRNSKAHCALGR